MTEVLGIAPTSTICPLPEVKRDIDQFCKFAESEQCHTRKLICPVVTIADVVAACAAIPPCENAVIDYSGHGLVTEDKQYALWLGNADNIYRWSSFVDECVRPLSERAKSVTIIVDSCFAGRAKPKRKADTDQDPKPHGTPKSLSDITTLQPKHDLSEDMAHRPLLNVAVVTAVGRNEIASGQWVAFTDSGGCTSSTSGMSLFHFGLVNQLWQHKWIRYVYNNNGYFRDAMNKQGKRPDYWYSVKAVLQAADNQIDGLVMSQYMQCLINYPPRDTAPRARAVIGRSHNGQLL